MVVVSLVGTGAYEPVTYRWDANGRSYRTEAIAEALAHIFEATQVFVLATARAQQSRNLAVLRDRLGDRLAVVSIPDGTSQEELWEIFDRCTESIPTGSRVVLDITHAFRSLPLVVVGAVAYLQRTRRVEIARIVYGAYEAKDASGCVPIFDMTLLVDLLEWIVSAEALQRRGDATLLARQLQQTHQRLWQDGTTGDLPQSLKGAADELERLSRAVHLARPREVLVTAADLLPKFDAIESEAARWAKPFGVIAADVRAELERIAYKGANKGAKRLDAENLRRQLALVAYMLEKRLLVQATMLAREWLVSWVAYHSGIADWLNRAAREAVEARINGAAHGGEGTLADIPSWQQLVRVWGCIADLRNDIAHCGMNKNPVGAGRLESRLRDVLAAMEKLAASLDAPDRRDPEPSSG